MPNEKLAVLSPLPGPLIKALLATKDPRIAEEAKIVTHEVGSPESLPDTLENAEAILGDYTFRVSLGSDLLRHCTGCKLIQQPSAGYEHIDVQKAAELGIPVANVPGANALSVAEHTIMLILACLKKLILAHQKTASGEWAQDEMAIHGVFELYSKTLGIIGAGRIGQEVARRAKPFGCKIVYYDEKRLDSNLEEELGISYMDLDELVKASDVVTLHVPLTPETKGLMNAQRINSMKRGSVLVNVARGGIIDEAELAKALEEGQIAGAGIDVFSTEPPSKDNPLLKAPNVVLTPHIAGATNESRLRIINAAIENIIRVLRGMKPENVVNGV